ncbi:ChaN family lipoprotein [Acidovorax sp. SUPP3334]|uniref:ChaN family lipoprotein n=1 Tax=Acidovorax sp. SUPP3334 TaxID=2920881 RepID=UPI0023DE2506|nr:ChaN family lipoprotein [Acidovorax sp. SUPP3334]GKT24254.1 ChaN family lipoprotein [Acidovorax sp. SUPP3334]
MHHPLLLPSRPPASPSGHRFRGAGWPAGTRLAATALLALVVGCAQAPRAPAAPTPWLAQVQALLPADVLLIGEQHDAPEHQALEREAVQWLAARGQLAALVMEMADSGRATDGLPRDATEAQVQQALGWNAAAWPWAQYGPVALAAVRAGVPVRGGNLPRTEMREAMRDERWDRHLDPAALQRQYTALREGHCGLLPEAQIPGMARIQIARDARMAAVAAAARRPGQVVVLVAGGGHVLRSVGVPTHWFPGLVAKVALAQAEGAPTALPGETDAVHATPALPPRDHCAELRGAQGATQ